MAKCLYCYQEIAEGQLYHPTCAKKIFGSAVVPKLQYTHEQLEDLALQVVRSQTTVTGVQQKLSLDITPKDKQQPTRFTIVGLWGRFILKPQSEQFEQLPEVEDLTMHLAQIAKIQVVPHALIPLQDGQLGYITRRIDRTNKGEKIAMEDLCQLSEFLTENKYKGSYEQVAKKIKQFAAQPLINLVTYWEVVLFSWLTGNADMHLKNFSLYAPQEGVYQLTPAYDLLSTALVMPEDTEELALTLCGKKRKITRENFVEAMTQSGLSMPVIEKMFARFRKLLPAWEECIAQSFLSPELQVRYKEIIHERMSRIAQ